MEFSENIQRTDPRRFNPFREGNVLPKLHASLRITDSSLIVQAASGMYPVSASILQSVFEPSCFREETLRKVSTFDGFGALISGDSDIFIVTPPSDEQQEMLDQSGLPIRRVVLCNEPLVFLANRRNLVDNLTVQQIKDMYFGSIDNWRDVGGRDLPVTTYQLEKGNGSQSVFEQLVKNNPIDPKHVVIKTMPEIVDIVAKDEGGICYAYWSYYSKMYANRLTKILNINDRGPLADDYPCSFPVYMLYREDSPKAAVHELAEWSQTEEGREIIRRGNLCWRSVS